jgi:SAM-dependent MidA family methyltransferase
MAWMSWREATERALYGPAGFYRGSEGPAAHFRTSVHASPLFAQALLRLARACDLTTVVDVGAGRGELLVALRALAPGLELVGVERAPRPHDLPADVDWLDAVPPRCTALVVANEWLDNVPVDCVELTTSGPRTVLVDPSTGRESLGDPPSPEDTAWLERWWPLVRPGQRAEVGAPRDAAWGAAVADVGRGVLVAVDYAHRRGDRPPHGSLTGYRRGRQVPPVPDGTCDVTSHVALDACAAAGEPAGATGTLLTAQAGALTALGLTAVPPPPELVRTEPLAYLAGLAEARQAAELLSPGGLGGFGWLVQSVGMPLPALLLGVAGAVPRQQREL